VTLVDTTIRTARLDLVPFTAAALEALIANDAATASSLMDVELPADLGRRAQALLILRLADLRQRPDAGAWLLRTIAARAARGRVMVGLTGFHGPPDAAGTAELGYEVDPAHRRRGYAVEAAGALAEWALRTGLVRRVVAAIRPDNEASLAVARRLGFTPAGSRWDAVDGTALLFERRSPVARGGS
jgi:RimJ/RimL family protein N-acetyltransferase